VEEEGEEEEGEEKEDDGDEGKDKFCKYKSGLEFPPGVEKDMFVATDGEYGLVIIGGD
jgi:hypothetical protein